MVGGGGEGGRGGVRLKGDMARWGTFRKVGGGEKETGKESKVPGGGRVARKEVGFFLVCNWESGKVGGGSGAS